LDLSVITIYTYQKRRTEGPYWLQAKQCLPCEDSSDGWTYGAWFFI